MEKTITVEELRQDLNRVLRDVRAGATYRVTDHGEAIAEITGIDQQLWVPVEEVNPLLDELGADRDWGRELDEDRAAEPAARPGSYG